MQKLINKLLKNPKILLNNGLKIMHLLILYFAKFNIKYDNFFILFVSINLMIRNSFRLYLISVFNKIYYINNINKREYYLRKQILLFNFFLRVLLN